MTYWRNHKHSVTLIQNREIAIISEGEADNFKKEIKLSICVY